MRPTEWVLTSSILKIIGWPLKFSLVEIFRENFGVYFQGLLGQSQCMISSLVTKIITRMDRKLRDEFIMSN
jgi:hypothetical protein